jgi:hypothetical protein
MIKLWTQTKDLRNGTFAAHQSQIETIDQLLIFLLGVIIKIFIFLLLASRSSPAGNICASHSLHGNLKSA